jgi:hypothetical protein
MKANVGGIDRGLRVLGGIALLAFFALGEGSVRYIGMVGIVPLLTGLFGFCPLYSILGLNTCPRRA